MAPGGCRADMQGFVTACQKHPCKDCGFCQFCPDARCAICRQGPAPAPKLSFAEQIALFERVNGPGRPAGEPIYYVRPDTQSADSAGQIGREELYVENAAIRETADSGRMLDDGRMLMKPMVPSIEIALENEMRERDFYLQQAARTTSAVGKQMFTSIAADEEQHYQRLKQLHDELVRNGTWPAQVPGLMRGTDVRLALALITQAVDKYQTADADDRQAVETAIAFEERGYQMYADLRDAADTEAARSFFELMAGMEREHLLCLKETQLFFEDPATWHEEHEKPHFEA